MSKTLNIIVAAGTLALAGCASTTPTRELSSGYAIFDIKAGPAIGPARIADAVKVALQKNMSSVQVVNGDSAVAATGEGAAVPAGVAVQGRQSCGAGRGVGAVAAGADL